MRIGVGFLSDFFLSKHGDFEIFEGFEIDGGFKYVAF